MLPGEDRQIKIIWGNFWGNTNNYKTIKIVISDKYNIYLIDLSPLHNQYVT
jgi:hypothetical protein